METPSKKSSFPTETPNTADQTRPTDTEPKKETVSLNKDTSKAPSETAESEKAADAKAAKAENPRQASICWQRAQAYEC